MRRRRSEPRGSAGWQPAVSPTGSRQALRTTGVLLSDAPSPSPQREEGWGEGGRPRSLSACFPPKSPSAFLPHPDSPAGREGKSVRCGWHLGSAVQVADALTHGPNEESSFPITSSVPPDTAYVPPMTLCVSPERFYVLPETSCVTPGAPSPSPKTFRRRPEISSPCRMTFLSSQMTSRPVLDKPWRLPMTSCPSPETSGPLRKTSWALPLTSWACLKTSWPSLKTSSP